MIAAHGDERSLFVLLNTRCDIECAYCFYTSGHEERDDRIFSLPIDAFIDRIALLRFGKVILTGGDPLSRAAKSQTINLIGRLSSANIKVIVNTSAAFLKPMDCLQLAAANPTRVDISIDSHEKATHNVLRGRFDDSVSAIKQLSELGIEVHTTTVITNRNKSKIDETLCFLKAQGAVACHIQPAYLPTVSDQQPRTQRCELNLSDDLRSRMRRIASESRDPEVARSYFSLWEKYWGASQQASSSLAPYCLMGKNIFVCDAIGDLYGCFHRQDVHFGNLLQQNVDTLEEALKHNVLSAPDCPSCAGAHCVSLFSGSTNWI